EVVGTISGSILTLSGNASVSGSLVIVRSVSTKGTLSGESLIVSGVSSHSGAAVFKNNVTVQGTLSGAVIFLSGNATFGNSGITFSRSGAVVFNANSNNADFAIKSQGNSSMFYVDASANKVGIGTNGPETTLEVVGSISGASLQITGTGGQFSPLL